MKYRQALILAALTLVQISCGGGGGGSTTPETNAGNGGNNGSDPVGPGPVDPSPVDPGPEDPGPIDPGFSEPPFVMQSTTYSTQLAISAGAGSAASSRYQSTHEISLTHTQANH